MPNGNDMSDAPAMSGEWSGGETIMMRRPAGPEPGETTHRLPRHDGHAIDGRWDPVAANIDGEWARAVEPQRAGNVNASLGNGRYQVTSKIGEGGMSAVWLAWDTVLHRQVAIKRIHANGATNGSDTSDPMLHEARLIAKLANPNIVSIYDWFVDDGAQCLVEEYVPGQDLRSMIAGHGQLPIDQVISIGLHVSSALSAAHAHGVVHRDVKSANVLVSAEDGSVKVTDFGIARMLGESGDTDPGVVVGSPLYCSPEQVLGRDVDHRSDIYSLGVVMYEALCGHVPFQGSTITEVATKQAHAAPAPIGVAAEGVPSQLADIVMRCLEKDPEDRYQTADALHEALNELAHSRSVVTGETGLMRPTAPIAAYTAPKEQPKHGPTKGTVIGIVSAALIAVIAIAVFAFARASSVDVPRLDGLTREQASKSLSDVGLAIGDVTEHESDTVEKGKVISQDPKAGTETKKGEKVNIVLSSGPAAPERVKVPDIMDMTATEAENAIEDAGLMSRAQDGRYSDDIAVGHVCWQSPSGDTETDSGTYVEYALSLGPKPVERKPTVPFVVGQRQDEASATIAAAGYSPSVVLEYSDTVEEGVVISQTPSGGEEADQGSVVELHVSQGPEPKENVENVEPDQPDTHANTEPDTEPSPKPNTEPNTHPNTEPNTEPSKPNMEPNTHPNTEPSGNGEDEPNAETVSGGTQ